MKTMKKVLALLVAVLMIAASMSALAATPDTVPTAGTGKITINNAIKGETYTIYKLFNAEVGANGAIIYKGDIPQSLNSYFTKDADGNITATAAAKNGDKLSDAAATDMKTWATAQTSNAGTTVATGNTVVFDNLAFGYYVVTSTAKGDASVIMVDSTNTVAEIYEKNEKVPQPTKTVDDHTWSIGDTITYTVTFPGINFKGTGENAEVVTTYTVTDTLPAFLSNATVTGVTIGDTTIELTEANLPGVTTFGTNKTFDIPWADKVVDEADNTKWTWTSKYTNGSVVTITYTAVLTDIVNVGDKKNINTITVTRKTGKNNENEQPTNEHWEDDEFVYTYGAAIEKVDENGKPLAGAKFKVTGLTASNTADGVYTVTAYKPTGADAITLENSTEMEVGADGMLYIVGLQEALALTITETQAPVGYNKLTESKTLTTQPIGEKKLVKKTTGYREYDAKGNLIRESVTEITADTGNTVENQTQDLSALTAAKLQVTNNKGTELPSTGGIGTTIFYIAGSLLAIGAAILLITKRRMGSDE